MYNYIHKKITQYVIAGDNCAFPWEITFQYHLSEFNQSNCNFIHIINRSVTPQRMSDDPSMLFAMFMYMRKQC